MGRTLDSKHKHALFIQEMAEHGDPVKAAVACGFTQGTAERYARKFRQEIARAALDSFGSSIPQAMDRLKKLIASPDERIALAAAKDYLDRIGVSARRAESIPTAESDVRGMSDEQLFRIVSETVIAEPGMLELVRKLLPPDE